MTPASMPDRRTLVRVFGTLLGIGLLVYLLWNQGWDEIQAAFASIPVGILLLAGALILLSRFSVVARWYALLRSAEIPVSLTRALQLTFAGLFSSNFLPTTIGGDFVRLGEVANLAERRMQYAASLVVDRAIGVIGMATVLPFGLRTALGVLPSMADGLGRSEGFRMAAAGGLSARIQRLWQGAEKRIGELIQALRLWLHRPRGVVASMLATWSHMLFRFGALWFLFRALGEQLTLLEIAGLWSFVYFVTLVPISINGLGVQELSMTFVFTELAGVSASGALTVAILLRTLEMAASLPGALVLQGVLPGLGSPESDGDPAAEAELELSSSPPASQPEGVGIRQAGSPRSIAAKATGPSPEHRSMRILVFNYEFPPVGGGGGRASADLCQALAERGHDLRVITTRAPGLPEWERLGGYQVHRVWTGRRSRFRASLPVMASYVAFGLVPGWRAAKGWQPDLIHAHFGVPTGALAYSVSRLTGVPYVLTAHLGDVPGGVPEKTDHWFRVFDPLTPPIWCGAEEVVAVSEHTRRLVRSRYGLESTVVPNGIELAVAEAQPAHNPPRLIFAGRFQPQKNLPFLFEALAQVKELPWDLRMVGDGPHRARLERQAHALELEDRIRFLGWVSSDQVLDYLSESDLLVIPSRSEGLPVVAVQALSQGLAVAASKAGGLAEVVKDGHNGVSCPVDDLDCYVAGLRRCLTDREVLSRMKAASLLEAQRYDMDRVTEAYENVFRRAVGE